LWNVLGEQQFSDDIIWDMLTSHIEISDGTDYDRIEQIICWIDVHAKG
jgi:hypothetical protein